MHKVENKKTRCLNIPEMIQGRPDISSDFLYLFDQYLENFSLKLSISVFLSSFTFLKISWFWYKQSIFTTNLFGELIEGLKYHQH